MESSEILATLGNLGGMGFFSWVVYVKLKELTAAFKGMSDAFIKMEERGAHLAAPPRIIHRPITEDGSGG